MMASTELGSALVRPTCTECAPERVLTSKPVPMRAAIPATSAHRTETGHETYRFPPARGVSPSPL